MSLYYKQLVEAFGIDLVAIVLLAYGVYYRRYRRADLLLAYVALNVGLFVVGVMVLQQTHLGVAFGFGLFAILSIIRLRSDPVKAEEVAYYFVVLVLGLVNGMQFQDRWLTVWLNVAIVGVMFLLDNKLVMPRSKQQLVTLDVVHPNQTALMADLERRLGGKITHLIVKETDYVRDITVVDVRFVGPSGGGRPPRARAHELLDVDR